MDPNSPPQLPPFYWEFSDPEDEPVEYGLDPEEPELEEEDPEEPEEEDPEEPEEGEEEPEEDPDEPGADPLEHEDDPEEPNIFQGLEHLDVGLELDAILDNAGQVDWNQFLIENGINDEPDEEPEEVELDDGPAEESEPESEVDNPPKRARHGWRHIDAWRFNPRPGMLVYCRVYPRSSCPFRVSTVQYFFGPIEVAEYEHQGLVPMKVPDAFAYHMGSLVEIEDVFRDPPTHSFQIISPLEPGLSSAEFYTVYAVAATRPHLVVDPITPGMPYYDVVWRCFGRTEISEVPAFHVEQHHPHLLE